MIVSWNWLQDYVTPGVSAEEVADRLTMSGMNLESIEPRGGDLAIDLEVTSNRPDCLGHLGVAREVGVVCGTAFRSPDPKPAEGKTPIAKVTNVQVDCPELCPSYSARVIRGVKVGPSPQWLKDRLEAIGITPVNNVVDVTNYVLMECGQPLHAFDLDKLDGQRIVVRRGAAGEQLEAIDHRTYKVTPEMCVIADAKRPVAIAGVMGGAPTEVHPGTKNLLIESAAFAPASIRATARALNLHSPSSYRFERGVDLAGVDWASRRCCELILQTAGGELVAGAAAVGGPSAAAAAPVTMRLSRVAQVIGVDIPEDHALKSLAALGLERVGHVPGVSSSWKAPSWRRDLTREADLIEEVARTYGYQHISERASLPTSVVIPRPEDVVRSRVQQVLVAAGFFEAVTFSFTIDSTAALFVPPGAGEPLGVAPAAGEFGTRLRQSLIPSLVMARQENERHGVFDAELFEIARVFLDSDPKNREGQPIRLGLVSGRPFRELMGVIEAAIHAVNPQARMTVRRLEHAGYRPGRAAELWLGDSRLGWIGELDREGHPPLRDLKLREAASAAELDVATLVAAAATERKERPLSDYPSVTRDFNFVLDQSTSWEELESVVKSAAGPLLESVQFVDQYQGKQIPEGKKSYVLSLTYRAADRTLSSDEIDAAQSAVLAAVTQRLAAVQR